MLRLTKPFLDNNESLAVQKVLESGWLTEGPKTLEFESAVARYVDAKYAVAFCNCTVALEMCLRAMHVKRERVAIPDFTHPATALAVINSGNTPVLTDVSLETYNINGHSEHTTLSMPVSWGGNPLTWYPPSAIVEDAACSLGASVNGVKVGANFTSCFSFHPRKIVTTGEGAVVTTNDRELAVNLRSLRCFGVGGGNYRFSDVAAAIGIEQMRKIERIIKVRREMAEVYDGLLSQVEGVVTPAKSERVRHTYQTYAVFIRRGNRDRIIKLLAAKGIETQIGTYALHLMPQFRRLPRMSRLDNSTQLYWGLLSLPMSYDLTFDDQQKVVAELAHAVSETSNY